MSEWKHGEVEYLSDQTTAIPGMPLVSKHTPSLPVYNMTTHGPFMAPWPSARRHSATALPPHRKSSFIEDRTPSPSFVPTSRHSSLTSSSSSKSFPHIDSDRSLPFHQMTPPVTQTLPHPYYDHYASSSSRFFTMKPAHQDNHLFHPTPFVSQPSFSSEPPSTSSYFPHSSSSPSAEHTAAQAAAVAYQHQSLHSDPIAWYTSSNYTKYAASDSSTPKPSFARYQHVEYQGPASIPAHRHSIPWSKPEPTTAPLASSDQSEEPVPKKKRKQSNGAITVNGKRRSPNGFFVYCDELRPVLKRRNPNARNTDINRELGSKWKALSQEVRDHYKQRADRIRAQLPEPSQPLQEPPVPPLTSLHPTEPNPDLHYMPSTHSSSSSSLPSYTSKHHAPAMTIAASDDDNDDNQPPNTTFRPAQDLIQIHKPLSQPHLDPAHQRALTEPHRSSNSPPHLDPVSHFDSYHQPPSSSSSSSSILNVASYSGAAEATALEQAVASTTSKPETRLKRPPNAYLLFNKELRPKLLEEHESLSVASISKMISDQWKSLPPDEKNRYIQMAAQLKDELLKKHPDYVYTRRSRAELERVGYKSKSLKRQQNPPVTQHDHTAPEHALQLDPSIAYPSNRPFPYNHTDTHLSADKHDPTPPMPSAKKERRVPDPRGRKKKKHKNPHGPKHPMSGFLFFASHTRPEVVRDYPKYNVGMVSKVIARMWNDMSDPEKQPWVEKAIKDKARYAREMEEYNRAKQSPRDVDNSSQEYTPASSSTMTTDAATIAKASDRTRLRAMILENASHDDDDRRSHDHYYSPTSRIHSVLSHPRPNSPTEVDDDTIAAVAQMVNPKHHHIGIHQPRHDHQNHLVAPLSSSSSSTSSLQGDSPPPITALHYPQHDHESLFHRFHGPATPPSPSIEHPL